MLNFYLIGEFFFKFGIELQSTIVKLISARKKMSLHRFCIPFMCCFLMVYQSMAGELVLTGVYHGSNLYVQNPHDGENNYCIKDIYVNGKKHMDAPKSSVFTIDLSSLKESAQVKIEIYHTDGCEPKIINPNAIRVKEEFQFIFLDMDDHQIHWKSKGEKKLGKYFIEKFEHNTWQIERAVDGRGDPTANEYRKPVDHHAGENKYRLKYLEISGRTYYSEEIVFVSSREKITFSPQRVSSKLYFSRTTDYEIADAYGNKVMSGRAEEVDCSKLKMGVYYLSFDNRTEKFIKK